MKKSLLSLVITSFIAFTSPASGLTTILYNFEDTWEPLITGPGTGRIFATDITSTGSSNFLSNVSGRGSFIAYGSSWSQLKVFDPGTNFWEFTVAPDPGFRFELASFSTYLGRSETGPTSVNLQYSTDHFATEGVPIVEGFAVSGSEQLVSFIDSDTSISFAGPTTFRIWGYGATHPNGRLRFDDLQLTGTLSAVPEPATIGSWFGALVIGALLVSRWRRRSIRNSAHLSPNQS